MIKLLSGKKRSYYGKGETIVYRLHRDGNVPEGELPILGASLTLIVWGDAFWPTYATGDNTNLIATDSMKNFLQRETLNYPGYHLSGLAHFLARKFIMTYPQAEGVELHAEGLPFERIGLAGFRPSCGPRPTVRLWLGREGDRATIQDLRVGLRGYELLRLGGSAFHGFVRDEYTTLPEMRNRPLRMKLAVEWSFLDAEASIGEGDTRHVHHLIEQTFEALESGSIQQLLHEMGLRVLSGTPNIDQIDLEGQNHTWDAVVESGEHLGLFTIAKPFYGILGLKMTRVDLQGA